MEEYSGGSKAWKKKPCIALMVLLLIGKASLLQGEAASPVQTGNSSDSETELSEEKTEATETEDIETDSQEFQEIKTGDKIEGTQEKENSVVETPETDTLEPDMSETEDPSSENVLGDIQESKETENDAHQTALPDGEALGREEGLTYLQIPEKLEIVIDPWEIDERGQIYSEPFIVKNLGNAPGVLTLSFVYGANGEDGANICDTQEGFRASGEKLIYMKVVFGNGEEFVFTREGVQCEAELGPGEELTLWFSGEVNEYAEEPWKSEDMEIEGIYSWKIEEILSNETEDVSTSELNGIDDREEVSDVETENILPIESDEGDSGEEAPPAGIEGETSEEESVPPAESDEKSSSEEVPFVELTEEAIEESGPSENMSEE